MEFSTWKDAVLTIVAVIVELCFLCLAGVAFMKVLT